jgi:hypothetical protein
MSPAFAEAKARQPSRHAEPKPAKRAKAGGADRDRTGDLMLAKHALSQLSYSPTLAVSLQLLARAANDQRQLAPPLAKS